jgi:hypothetical protein
VDRVRRVLCTVYVCIYVCRYMCTSVHVVICISVVYEYTNYVLRLDTKWKNFITDCLFIGRHL